MSSVEKNSVPDLYLSQLAIYPVKSLAQISLEKSRLDAFGLQHDRRWMVVDSQGRMMTQRQQAHMCLIRQQLGEQAITLEAPGMSPIEVAIPSGNPDQRVKVWEDSCRAIDCGETAAQWLQQFLAQRDIINR